MIKASALVVLDPRRQNKEGKYPLKLRITHNRVRKYYGIGLHSFEGDFQRIRDGKRLTKDDQLVRTSIQNIEEKAQSLIKDIQSFTFEIFEKRFNGNDKARTNILEAYEENISELTTNEQLSTAANYQCAINSLLKFKGNVLFLDITPEYLKSYEKWMKINGKSPTTISMYLRTLRTLINKAIHNQIIPLSSYPFGRYNYTVPAGRNIKKALLLKDIGLIYNYTPPNEMQSIAKDYWIFSYLCNGINPKDIALLTWDSIEKDILRFERAKTASTKQVKEEIRIPLSKEALRIIKKRSNKRGSKDDYIFPILNSKMNPVEKKRAIQQCIQNINKNMKKIALKLGIDANVTTYTARHSFATVLMKSGASTEMIGEALGHSDVKTTKRYLGSFEDVTKQKIYTALTNFT